MRYYILILFILISIVSRGQSTLPLRADTVLIEKTGGNGELKIKNSTRDSLGLLVNIGGGKTRFMRAKVINDSTVVIPPGDTLTIRGNGGISAMIGNGLTNTGDSIVLGGILDRYTHIQTIYDRKDNTQTGFNSLMLSNTSKETSEYWWLSPNGVDSRPYERAPLYISKTFGDNDTLLKSYGGTISTLTKTTISPGATRYKSSSTPLTLPYGGPYAVHQLFPPDTSYLNTSPFGHTAVFAGDLGFGNSNAFRITAMSQANISYPYPITVNRMGMDFARTTSDLKREFLGNPFATYTADYRSYQNTISSGTTEYGSNVNKWIGFYSYGGIYSHTASPSKAKTVAVSNIDTAIGHYNPGMYLDKNEVSNGYGFVDDGILDRNHFKGKTKFGGSRPYTNDSETFQVYIDSTLKVGRQLTTAAYQTMYGVQSGITPATLSSKKIRGLWAQMDYTFDQNTNISSSFIEPFTARLFLYADSIQTASAGTAGNGLSGGTVGFFLRKKAGYLDTTTFVGGATSRAALSAFNSRADFSDAPGSVTRMNIMTGYFAGITPIVQFSDWNKVHKFIWFNSGAGTFGSGNASIDTGYHMYMPTHNAAVQTKYALYQEGTTDTNYLAGPLRMPNITEGLNTDRIVVKSSNGVIKDIDPSSLAGGAGLVSTFIGYGSGSNLLTGDADFSRRTGEVQLNGNLGIDIDPLYDIHVENATGTTSLINTSALSSTAGGKMNLFTYNLPTASGNNLGGIWAGSRNAATAESYGASIQFNANGAWTNGSNHATHIDFFTAPSNSGTPQERMRIMHNGNVGVGVTSATATLHLKAGSATASTGPLKFTSGTVTTTPEAGLEEYDGTSRFFTPASTRLRYALTDNSIPSNGQIPVGNGTNFTNATLTAGEGINIANASGSITINARETGTMSGDGSFTIASNIGLQRLIDITADRTVTLPTPTEGKRLIIWNANSNAFTWNVSGSLVNAAGTAITSLVNDTVYQFIGTGTEWLLID